MLPVALRFLNKPIVDLHDRQDGGAYTLSYAMVIPILMLLTCVVVESALVMCAKVGTAYSAFSGARTAIVWSSANDNWAEVEERVEAAAVQSFVPFASGMGASGSASSSSVSRYISSYGEFAQEPAAENYLRAKYANAETRLKVTTSGAPANYDSDIKVTVEYRFKFNIPGIGRLIGEQDGDGYSFPLTSSVTLQNEGPQNQQQRLGIGYGTFD